MLKQFYKKLSLILAAAMLITSTPFTTLAAEEGQAEIMYESVMEAEDNEASDGSFDVSENASDAVEGDAVDASENISGDAADDGAASAEDMGPDAASTSEADASENVIVINTEDASAGTPSDATDSQIVEDTVELIADPVDGVQVTVTAPAGALPEGATLSVTKIKNSETLKDIEAAVDNTQQIEDAQDEVTGEADDEADSESCGVEIEKETYTFDIKILDAQGNEVQPDDTVEVKFTPVENTGLLYDAKVYHIEDNSAAKTAAQQKLLNDAIGGNVYSDEETAVVIIDGEDLDGEIINDLAVNDAENTSGAVLSTSGTEGAQGEAIDAAEAAAQTEDIELKDTPLYARELETAVNEDGEYEVRALTNGFSSYVVQFYFSDSANYTVTVTDSNSYTIETILTKLGLTSTLTRDNISYIGITESDSVTLKIKRNKYQSTVNILSEFEGEVTLTIWRKESERQRIHSIYYIRIMCPGKATAKIGNNYYYSLDAAFNAVDSNQSIVVLKDITAASQYTVSKQNVSLDMNGHTITGNAHPQFTINSGASLTVSNGTIYYSIAPGSDSPALFDNYGALTIEDGTYHSDSQCYIVYDHNNASTTIKDGNLYTYYSKLINHDSTGSLSISGGTFTSFRGSAVNTNGPVSISGGTFKDFYYIIRGSDAAAVTVTGGKFTYTTAFRECSSGNKGISGGSYISDDIKSFVSDGYHTEHNSSTGYYDVKKGAYIAVIVRDGEMRGGYTNLQDAVNAAVDGDIIRIQTNATIADQVTFPNGKSVTLDLQGYTLTCSQAVRVSEGSGLTIEADGGGITSTGAGIFLNSGSLTINSGNYEAGNGICFVNYSDGNLIINSGTFTALCMFYGNNIEINGGGFIYDTLFYDADAGGSFKGGSFLPSVDTDENRADIEACVADGYALEDSEVPGYRWTVVKDTFNVAEVINSSGKSEGKYRLLGTAIVAADSGDTVKLIKDTTVNTLITIISGKKLTLDLNGYNITDGTGALLFANNGEFNVKATGGGEIYGSVLFKNSGTLNIEGGIYSYAVKCVNNLELVDAECNITGGTFCNMGVARYVSDGYVMQSSTVRSGYYDVVEDSSKSYKAKIVRSDGEIRKWYDDLQTAFDEAIEYDTVVLINNCQITDALTVASGKSFTLDLQNYEISYKGRLNTVITNNGTLSVRASDKGKIFNGGISGTTVAGYAFVNNGNLNIHSGSFEAKTIVQNVNLHIVTISGGKYTYTTLNSGRGSIALTGGSYAPENRSKEELETITENTGYGVEASTAAGYIWDVVPVTYVAEVIKSGQESGTQYVDLKKAFDAAVSGDTIKMIGKASVSQAASLVVDDNITFDLNGYTVTGDSEAGAYAPVVVVATTGELTIIDSRSQGELVNEAATSSVIRNLGTLNIKSGLFESNGDTSCIVANKGTLNISDGTTDTLQLRAQYMFANHGTINASAGLYYYDVGLIYDDAFSGAECTITGGTYAKNDVEDYLDLDNYGTDRIGEGSYSGYYKVNKKTYYAKVVGTDGTVRKRCGLKEAFDFVNGQTEEMEIILLKDVGISTELWLYPSKTATFNLQNHILSAESGRSHIIKNEGTLTVIASDGGKLENTNASAIIFNNTGTLTIKSGKYNYSSAIGTDTSSGTWNIVGGSYASNNIASYIDETQYSVTEKGRTYPDYHDVVESSNVAKIVHTDKTVDYYSSLGAAFDSATTAGDKIVLLKSVTLAYTSREKVTLPQKAKATLDLNGCTITAPSFTGIINKGDLTITDSKGGGEIVRDSIYYPTAIIENYKKLTIESGSFSVPGTWGYLLRTNSGSEQLLKGGTYEADCIFISSGNETATISGGRYTYNTFVYDAKEYPLTCSITGGSFKTSEVSSYVADGYILKQNTSDLYWDVEKNTTDVARIENSQKTYTSLSAAFAAAQDGNTITMLLDTNLFSTINSDKNITLNLNGKTITSSDKAFNNNGSLTIKDTAGGGTLRTTGEYSDLIQNGDPATLTIEGGAYENPTVNESQFLFRNYGTINITGGKFTYKTFSIGQYGYTRTWNITSGSYLQTDIRDYLDLNHDIQASTTYPGYYDVIYSQSVATINNAYYSTVNAAFEAATDGDTITMLRDATVSEAVLTGTGKSVTLDLGTYTLAATDDNAITVAVGNTLTVNATSGGITSAVDGAIFSNSGNLVVNYGDYVTTAENGQIFENNGNLTVEAGNYRAEKTGSRIITTADGGTSALNGGLYTGTTLFTNNGTANVTGGTYLYSTGFDDAHMGGTTSLTGGSYKTDSVSGYVADDYLLVQNGGTTYWDVIGKSVFASKIENEAGVTVGWYANIEKAFASASEMSDAGTKVTVKVLNDLTIADGKTLRIDSSKDGALITLDLNGHTVDGNAAPLILNKGKLLVTATDSSAQLKNRNSWSSIIRNEGILSIAGGTYKGVNDMQCIVKNEGTLTVTSGCFDAKYMFMNSGSIAVNGGRYTYNTSFDVVIYDLPALTSASADNTALLATSSDPTCVITAGEYSSDDVADYVIPTKALQKNSDNYYEVVDAIAEVTDAEGALVGRYGSLNDAFATASDGDTVGLLDDIEVSDQIVVPLDKEITFNLATHSVTSSYTGTGAAFVNNATLSMLASSSDGISAANATLFKNNGFIAISGGKYTYSTFCSDNYSAEKWDITGGSYKTDIIGYLDQDHYTTQTSTEFSGYYDVVEGTYVAKLVSNGVVTRYTTLEAAFKDAKNDDTIKLLKSINIDGEIEVDFESIIVDLGEYTIHTKYNAFENDGIIYIEASSGGIVSEKADELITNAKTGIININGGIYDCLDSLFANKGTVNISNGKFTYYEFLGSSGSKTDWNITGGSYCKSDVYNYLDQDTYTICNSTAYDGYYDVMAIGDSEAGIVKNSSEEKIIAYYPTVEDAFEAAESGDKIVVLKDASISEGTTLYATASDLIFDLNGHSVEGNADPLICNQGSLTIQDRSDDASGKLKNNYTGSYVVKNEGTLYASGSELIGDYIFDNSKYISVTGGRYTYSNSFCVESGIVARDTCIISGGQFKTNEVEKYVVSTKCLVKHTEDENYWYVEDNDRYVAEVIDSNGNYVNRYETLKDAFAAAVESGDKVVLLKDASVSETATTSIGVVTLNIGSYKISADDDFTGSLIRNNGTLIIKAVDGEIIGGPDAPLFDNNGDLSIMGGNYAYSTFMATTSSARCIITDGKFQTNEVESYIADGYRLKDLETGVYRYEVIGYIAKVESAGTDDVYFESLGAAKQYAEGVNGTIVLLRDVVDESDWEGVIGADISLSLGNHGIEFNGANAYISVSSGKTFNITAGDNGYIKFTNVNAAHESFNVSGTLNINGGSYYAYGEHEVIKVSGIGKASISNARIESQDIGGEMVSVIDNEGETTISNTAVTGTGYYAIKNTGTMTVEGSKTDICGGEYAAVLNYSGLTLSGGTIRGTVGIEVPNQASGYVTLSGAVISAVNKGIDNSSSSPINILSGEIHSGNIGIDNTSYGQINMHGGSIITTSSAGDDGGHGIKTVGEVNVSGGRIDCYGMGIKSTANKVTVAAAEGSSVSISGMTGISAADSMVLSECTIHGDIYGVISYKDLTSEATISGDVCGLYNGGQLDITGGSISGEDYGILLQPENGTAVCTIKGSTYVQGGTYSVYSHDTTKVDLTVESGIYDGLLFIKNTELGDLKPKLTINGGTFNPSENGSMAVNIEKTSIRINNGIFNGTVVPPVGTTYAAEDFIFGGFYQPDDVENDNDPRLAPDRGVKDTTLYGRDYHMVVELEENVPEAVIMSKGKSGTLKAMMDIASPSDTVTMINNATHSDIDYSFAYAGAVLDLNGWNVICKSMTTDGATAGDIIDTFDATASNTSKGLLTADTLTLETDNEYMPLKNGNGYNFFNYGLESRDAFKYTNASPATSSYIAGFPFVLVFKDADGSENYSSKAYDLLSKASGDDCGIKLLTEVGWNGKTYQFNYTKPFADHDGKTLLKYYAYTQLNTSNRQRVTLYYSVPAKENITTTVKVRSDATNFSIKAVTKKFSGWDD